MWLLLDGVVGCGGRMRHGELLSDAEAAEAEGATYVSIFLL